MVKNLPANAGDLRNFCSITGSGRFPWRREWLPIPVFLPEESHGQRSLEGYSPWGRTESDATEVMHGRKHLLKSSPPPLLVGTPIWTSGSTLHPMSFRRKVNQGKALSENVCANSPSMISALASISSSHTKCWTQQCFRCLLALAACSSDRGFPERATPCPKSMNYHKLVREGIQGQGKPFRTP